MPHSPKDRLIMALSAQLEAERETRQALAAAIANGPVDREVMLAILGDPVPVQSAEDLALADRRMAQIRKSGRGTGRQPSPRHLREVA